MALDPQFATVPKMFLGQTTTAVTDRVTPGNTNTVRLIDAGRTFDLAIKRVSLAARGPTTKAQIMFWIGTTTDPQRRWGREYEVSAVATVDVDDPAWSFDVVNEVNDREPWLILPKDKALWVSCTSGDDIDIVAMGAEFQ